MKELMDRVGQDLRNPAAREAYLTKARKNARWIKTHGGRYVTYSTLSGAGARRTARERKIIAEAFDRVADVALSEGCTPLYHNHYVEIRRLAGRRAGQQFQPVRNV